MTPMLRRAVLVLAASLALAGCSSDDEELDAFIASVKAEASGKVEPLPEIKPYKTFSYSAAGLRSPFEPNGPINAVNGSNVRPDSRRNREFLEQFSLDTLRMVGTLDLGSKRYGLVRTKDGLVHRVLPGNYMGQSDGRILEVGASKITLVEIVPDGVGGYMERPAALALSE